VTRIFSQDVILDFPAIYYRRSPRHSLRNTNFLISRAIPVPLHSRGRINRVFHVDSSRHWSCVSVINPILARFKWRYPLSWDNGAYDGVWRLLAILSIPQKWYSSVLIGSASNRSMTEGCSWIKSSSSASKCARRWTMKSFSGRESIKPRSRGLELRPKAEKPWAQKHRVFRW
jgi:hypothetical protein